ncbi:MAG: MoaD/ThiS family protein [Deltaproteobacteria bacterium]|nr:MoaD/ThiS family protein [Deltaproteobacteria bacterium]
MPVHISIPTALRGYAGGAATVAVEACTAGAALDALCATHPGLANHLRTADGKLRSFVNVYKGEDDIRHLDRDATALVDGDTLTIVPSIAGGARE